ncbi:MAG: M14 family zinc carboxypeptidase [candidate division KSB1 bacterium]|nr:M14 family zinc carboxypeptidase [candidate division KSB1 bacterium]MDZ7365649.1 M14 family zinc carboxypeptidase [candidate division KSB1 bacterium]MDZ7403275.1 M14 family zinc carboxypeptidase [candidate division KSB1 bacterium]
MTYVKVSPRFATIPVPLMWLSFVIIAFSTVQAQNRSAVQAQAQPLKYSQVRVYIADRSEINALAEAGLAVDHIDSRGAYIDAVFNNQEVTILRNTGKRYDILVDDLEAAYRRRPPMSQPELQALKAQMRQLYATPSNFNFGSMGGYLTFAEVVAELDEMRTLYPNLISARQSLGKSIENRDLWMVKISDNPEVDEAEQEILYTALHHAREPQSMTTLIYFMWYMLESYGSDPTVTNLVDNRELYFVPVVNPDGYVYNQQTNPNGGGLWRKNRRNNGNGTFGVDLNRNYGYQWGYNNSGSSPTPSSETYRGTAPFSEPETQAMRNFALSRQFRLANNYHSYGNYLIFPWGYIANFYTPDHSVFLAWGQDMTQFNNYVEGTANQTVGYTVNGEANDWLYGEQTLKGKVFGFTTEVGSGSDGFWPSQSRIIPLADENIYPNLVLATGVTDWTPPVISNVQATNVTATSALITWTTDENSNSVVEYGLTTGYGSTVSNGTNLTSHSMTLNNLTANTLYHYRVKSTDPFDNATTSGDFTFQTAVNLWQVITLDNFESSMGSYTDGGADMSRYTGGTHAHQGVAAANIQDNSGVASSFYHTASSNVTGYQTLEVDFWFKMVSMETGEDFWVQYFNGTTWQTVATFTAGTTYQNNVFYRRVVTISRSTHNFPTNAKLRFMCDASDNNDDVYIDEIEFRGLPNTALLAKGNNAFNATAALPASFQLHQNYPNPFNPGTNIRFDLPNEAMVKLTVHNLLGQEVAQLVNSQKSAGRHEVFFDGAALTSGVYYYRLEVQSATEPGKFVEVRKMALVR